MKVIIANAARYVYFYVCSVIKVKLSAFVEDDITAANIKTAEASDELSLIGVLHSRTVPT